MSQRCDASCILIGSIVENPIIGFCLVGGETHLKLLSDKELSVSELYQLDTIFRNKQWPRIDYENSDHIYDNFVDMLKNFDDRERALLLSLTNDFTWIQENSYIHLFREALSNMLNTYVPQAEDRLTVVFCPLLAETDINNPTKSTYYLLYKIKRHLPMLRKEFDSYSVNLTYIESRIIDGVNRFPNNSVFVLVDDFVGSGRTVESALKYLKDSGISKNTVILALAAMEAGMEYLRASGVEVFVAKTFSKGLTGKYGEECIDIMNSIEEKIKVAPDFHFGYMESEGLVKLSRTPNNTFPVYWFNKRCTYTPPFWR